MSVRVSVITVCYNADDTIEATVHSVLAQTYKNLEFIVVDGASKDNTLAVLQPYRQHIDVLISEPDRGVYDAMNKGIRRASGDLVVFMNANDRFHSHETVANAVRRFHDTGADIVFGDVVFVNPVTGRERVHSYAHFTHSHSFYYDNICHQSLFYRRALLADLGGYNLDYRIYADYEMNLRLFLDERVLGAYLPEPIAYFMEGGLSDHRNKARQRQQRGEIRQLMDAYFGQNWRNRALNYTRSLSFYVRLRKLFGSIFKRLDAGVFQSAGCKYPSFPILTEGVYASSKL